MPPQETASPYSHLIKSPEDIEGMRRAGKANGELMDYIRDFVKEGISTEKIDQLVHEYTLDNGYTPATLGYHGYPKSCCTSINNVVCHGIPSPYEILREGDIVNVDLTTIVDGYYGDSSETFLIGETSDDTKRLVRITGESLTQAINGMKPGIPLNTVGKIIQPYVEQHGYSVVVQYTGHGIGRIFHEEFSVCHHITREYSDFIIQPGMTFTIEPMVNAGTYKVVTDRKDKWTVRTQDNSLSAQFEHTILITETGAEVLTLAPSQREAGRFFPLPE